MSVTGFHMIQGVRTVGELIFPNQKSTFSDTFYCSIEWCSHVNSALTKGRDKSEEHQHFSPVLLSFT